MSRKCGECRACCYTHGVEQIQKPAWQHCLHECQQGCAIYQSRPSSCRNFECIWLQGRFEEGDRPDQTGIVLTPGKTLTHNGQEICKVIVAHEVQPGAARQGRADQLLHWILRRNISVIIVEDQTNRSFLPCNEMAKEAFNAIMRAHGSLDRAR